MEQSEDRMNWNADPMAGEDEARSEATFRFKIEEFSKLRDTTLSPPTYIRNLPWKIMAMPRTIQMSYRQSTKSLGFFLQCNGESDSTTWSCNTSAELRIISQKEGVENICRKIQHIFYSKENDWGFGHFLGWNDILDPEKGYIKDDAVILEVWVSADAPHGVRFVHLSHSEIYRNFTGILPELYSDLQNILTISNSKYEKYFD